MEASYSIVQKENEYRIILTSANVGALPDDMQKILALRNIDVSELIIDRISGNQSNHVKSVTTPFS